MTKRTRTYVILLVAAIILGALLGWGIDKASAACTGPAGGYAGCSAAQIAKAEAGTKHKVKVHYHKHRWGQSHNEWAGLTKRENAKLGGLYHHAVLRYEASHKAAAQPKYLTWRAFKADTHCLGTFHHYSGPSYCSVGPAPNAMDHFAHNTGRFVLKCGGVALGAAATGAYAATQEGVAITVPAAALIGGTGGAIGCTVQTMWNAVWGWF